MKQKMTTLFSDYCWVYITRKRLPSPQYNIGLAMDLYQLFNDNPEKELLYYRQFSNTLDGMAHKLLLIQMNEESLRLLIRGMNPHMRILNKEFCLTNQIKRG